MHRRQLPIHPQPLLSITKRRLAVSSLAMSLKRKQAGALAKDDAKKPKKNGDLTSFFGAPKATPIKSQAEAVINFDKDKWVASLTPEQKTLLKLEIDTMHPSWLRVLKEELLSRDFLDLKRFLEKEVSTQTIYPPMADVYSWYYHPGNSFVRQGQQLITQHPGLAIVL